VKQGDKKDRGISNIEQRMMKDEVKGEDRRKDGKNATGNQDSSLQTPKKE